MTFVKGLALVLLSALLFFCLSIFGLAFMLNSTILNPDFVVSEVDKLDIPSLIEEVLGEQIPSEEQYLAEVLDDTLTDLEPWMREQVSAGIYSSYDYLMGRSRGLSLVIPMEPVRDSLKQNLRKAILQSPPPELEGAPPGAMELYLNEAYRQIDEQIPQSFEFDEGSLSPEVLALLEQVRQGISYFRLGYKFLLGLILLLIVGIILIHRQVKGASLGIGITFLTCGILSYAGILIAKYLARTQLTQLDMPTQLQTLLPQLINDFLAPLGMFCIGLMVAGVALIIVYFVYKQRQAPF